MHIASSEAAVLFSTGIRNFDKLFGTYLTTLPFLFPYDAEPVNVSRLRRTLRLPQEAEFIIDVERGVAKGEGEVVLVNKRPNPQPQEQVPHPMLPTVNGMHVDLHNHLASAFGLFSTGHLNRPAPHATYVNYEVDQHGQLVLADQSEILLHDKEGYVLPRAPAAGAYLTGDWGKMGATEAVDQLAGKNAINIINQFAGMLIGQVSIV